MNNITECPSLIIFNIVKSHSSYYNPPPLFGGYYLFICVDAWNKDLVPIVTRSELVLMDSDGVLVQNFKQTGVIYQAIWSLDNFPKAANHFLCESRF